MRRPFLLCALAAVATLVGACSSSDTAGPPPPNSDSGVVPEDTIPVPGDVCDTDADDLLAPTIIVGSESTDASFGVGADACGTLTGNNGFIVYSFNPVLIDADGPVTVRVNGGAAARVTWSLATFTQSGDGEWRSTEPTEGCDRLLIDLTSASGRDTATYGADIRVGGADVACPQREIDASDPNAESVPLESLPEISTDPTGGFTGDTTPPPTDSVATDSTGSAP
jgi:hypothetical protein